MSKTIAELKLQVEEAEAIFLLAQEAVKSANKALWAAEAAARAAAWAEQVAVFAARTPEKKSAVEASWVAAWNKLGERKV